MGVKKVSVVRTADRGLALEAVFREGVGREGIEPSWVAPGDFKSPASTISPPPQAGMVLCMHDLNMQKLIRQSLLTDPISILCFLAYCC